MRHRTAALIAWSLFGGYLSLTVAGGLLQAGRPSNVDILFALAFGGFPSVGAFVASRRPGNPVGWIFCIIGLVAGTMMFTTNYARYALIAKVGPLPGAEVAAWLSGWAWVPGFGTLLTFVPLLFPDGRLPSRRWKPVAWLAGSALGAMCVVAALTPGPIDGLEPIENPFGLERLEGISDAVWAVAFALFGGVNLLCVISLLLRFRRSRGQERQQLKWFTYSAALLFVLPIQFIPDPVANLLFLVPAFGLPIAVGIAILKYRLYDIDRIVNRALVYGSLTAVLAATYLAAVVGLGSLARSLTGQPNNAVVVAASTLAVAALFGPVRRRVQGFIDRHFYRRKYDAARTLESFGVKLRNEVDLDQLAAELVGVVRETMQPAHASLWLRTSEGSR